MNLRIGFCILLLGAGAAAAAGGDLASLSRSYRETPNARTHAALLAYAKAHSRSASGALALLAAAPVEVDQKALAEALSHLAAAQKSVPALADYVAYTRGMAQTGQQDYAAAIHSFSAVLAQSPESPLIPKAALQAARAALSGNQPKQALAILKNRYADLPQPQGDLLLASAFDAAGDSVSAAAYYQRVFYNDPAASEADQAGTALAGLRQKLGGSYPTPMPQAMLGRAVKLLDQGLSDRARGELDSLVQILGGAERDVAKVSLGAVLYQKRDNAQAYDYLNSLQVTAPEADAERLYYMVASARRLNNHD
ncbi:MAG: tetratricopeptide repeat protein, partial [Bryobacteraceae bacterium]